MLRRSLIALSVGVTLVTSTACGSNQTAGQQPTPSGTSTSKPVRSDVVIAKARVVPVQYATLSMPVGGIVSEVLVNTGSQVEAGKVLLRLQRSRQQAALSQAQATLAQAEARYQKLLEGATPEDIAAAKAQIDQSRALLTETRGSVTNADIAAAKAQLQQAQALLNRLLGGPKQTDLRARQAELEQAEATLATQRDQLSAAKTAAELTMKQAAERLTQAQSAYVVAKSNKQHVDDAGDDPITGGGLNDAQKRQYADALIQAEAALRQAEQAVSQAVVAYDAARQAEATGVRGAEQQVRAARAALDKLMEGAERDEIAAARAQVETAKANLARLSGQQRQGSLEAAQARLQQSEAALAQVEAGPQQSDLAIAQAEIGQAKAAIEQAEVGLKELELAAPFGGSVAEVNVRVGEYLTPGSAVVRVADTGTWEFETDDLTELGVVGIKEGDTVQIKLDALGDFAMAGTVKWVKAFGEKKEGDITYTVRVVPEKQDPRLRWNMTARIEFKRP